MKKGKKNENINNGILVKAVKAITYSIALQLFGIEIEDGFFDYVFGIFLVKAFKKKTKK